MVLFIPVMRPIRGEWCIRLSPFMSEARAYLHTFLRYYGYYY